MIADLQINIVILLAFAVMMFFANLWAAIHMFGFWTGLLAHLALALIGVTIGMLLK